MIPLFYYLSDPYVHCLLTKCTYRDNILAMTKKEEHQMNEGHGQKQFYQSLSVGFKKDTIRLMLAPLIRKGNLDDDQLMVEVNLAVDADKENHDKTKGSKSVSSNNLNADVTLSTELDAGNALVLKELKELSGTVKELSGLKDTVKRLEGRLNNLSNNSAGVGGGNSQNQTHRFIKCEACEEARIYCNHCSLCGESGHKRHECPKNV